MPELMVQIDGQTVALKDCAWLQTAPCGCVTAITTAATPGRVLATAEQAHKELCPRKRDRDKDTRDGLAFRLITMAHYRANIGARWECAAHTEDATDPEQLPCVDG